MDLRRVTIRIALVALVALPTSASAYPGDLDPTFSQDGRMVVAFSRRAQARAVAMQGTKIVLGGIRQTATGDMVLARVTRRGILDPTFGNQGRLSVRASDEGDWLDDLAVDPDGRIIAVGGATDGGLSKFLVVRLKPNGALDRSFGDDGIVLTGFSTAASAESIALTRDGKILVGGGVGDYPNCSFAVVRYLADGRRDRTFSRDGIALATFPNRPYALVEDLVPWQSGHVLAVGGARLGSEEEIGVASFTENGRLDEEFGGGDGKAIVDVGPWDRVGSIVLQAHSYFIVAGWTNPGGPGGADAAMFVRFNASGHLDHEWGDMGVVLHDADPGFEYWGGAVRTGTKIMLAGTYMVGGAVMRIRANGALDESFGDGGQMHVPFDEGEASFGSVAVQADGRLVAAGYAPDGSDTGFAVARLIT